jgi:hypothetical protein
MGLYSTHRDVGLIRILNQKWRKLFMSVQGLPVQFILLEKPKTTQEEHYHGTNARRAGINT